jgi:hypothetical protein
MNNLILFQDSQKTYVHNSPSPPLIPARAGTGGGIKEPSFEKLTCFPLFLLSFGKLGTGLSSSKTESHL